MNWMTSSKHRALQSKRGKRMQQMHFTAPPPPRETATHPSEMAMRVRLPLPPSPTPAGKERRRPERSDAATPWYAQQIMDEAESLDIQILRYGQERARGSECERKPREEAGRPRGQQREILMESKSRASTASNAVASDDSRCVFTPVKGKRSKTLGPPNKVVSRPVVQPSPAHSMAFYNDGEKVQVGSRSSFRGARDQVISDERQRQNTVAPTIGKSFYEEEDEEDEEEEEKRQKQGTLINSGMVIGSGHDSSHGTRRVNAEQATWSSMQSPPSPQDILPLGECHSPRFHTPPIPSKRWIERSDVESFRLCSGVDNGNSCRFVDPVSPLRPQLSTELAGWMRPPPASSVMSSNDSNNEVASGEQRDESLASISSARQKRIKYRGEGIKPALPHDRLRALDITSDGDASSSSQDSLLRQPPLHWQQKAFRFELPGFADGPTPPEQIVHSSSSSSRMVLSSEMSVSDGRSQRSDSISARYETKRLNFTQRSQNSPLLRERHEAKLAVTASRSPLKATLPQFEMTTRTQQIFRMVSERSQAPSLSHDEDGDRAEDLKAIQLRETTGLAVYMCTLVECYKIDERIRLESCKEGILEDRCISDAGKFFPRPTFNHNAKFKTNLTIPSGNE